MRGGHAVGARVAASENDDAFAMGVDDLLEPLARLPPVLACQVFHAEVHALQLSPGDGDVAVAQCTDGQARGIERVQDRLHRHIMAHIAARPKFDSFLRELRHATGDLVLGKLEIGNAIGHQAADLVVPLEDGHPVARPVELLGRRQAGRSASDHGDAPVRAPRRRYGHDPALRPRPVIDGPLDVLDGHRLGVVRQRARVFARRGTGVAGELGEVVGGMQTVDRMLPVGAAHQVVPVGNQVSDRTACHAGGHATIHAALTLPAHLCLVPRGEIDLSIIRRALRRRTFANPLSAMAEKAVGMVLVPHPSLPFRRPRLGGRHAPAAAQRECRCPVPDDPSRPAHRPSA